MCHIQKTLHSWWNKKVAFSITQIDDYVKHISREHSHEDETNGRSGSGVAIKGVDWDKWITISKIAIHLRMCTAMAAAVVGVCILIGILDLVLRRNLSMEVIN